MFMRLQVREGLCRCASLKKLILARNKLITLPDAIHLTELQVLFFFSPATVLLLLALFIPLLLLL